MPLKMLHFFSFLEHDRFKGEDKFSADIFHKEEMKTEEKDAW